MGLAEQTGWLFLLAIPVACVAWTVTHEEVFREAREWCAARSKSARRWWVRKLCYMLTCEYCFSHYLAVAAVLGTGFHLLLPGWRGSVLAILATVWVANLYMSVFVRLRLEIRIDRTEARLLETRSGEPGTIESRHPRGATVRRLSVSKPDAN